MAFERNDIVNKTRLMGELGEELMGFEHNDIVTVDRMYEAIDEVIPPPKSGVCETRDIMQTTQEDKSCQTGTQRNPECV